MIRTPGAFALTATAIAEIMPPAADRHDDALHLRELLEDLEPDRPLSRRGQRVFEGVEIPFPFGGSVLERCVVGVLVRRAGLTHGDREPAQLRQLRLGVLSGTNTTDRHVDAQALPRPMRCRARGYPPTPRTTPRRRSSSESAARWFSAPRTLNEPVGCQHSSFSQTFCDASARTIGAAA